VSAKLYLAPLFLVWWGLICALLVLSGVLLQRSFGRLRQAHFDVYKALGEPHILGDIRTTYPARRFVWSKQCRGLCDEVLTRRALLSYYSGIAAALLGLLLVVSIALHAVLRPS
jgi:hypothetical protein